MGADAVGIVNWRSRASTPLKAAIDGCVHDSDHPPQLRGCGAVRRHQHDDIADGPGQHAAPGHGFANADAGAFPQIQRLAGAPVTEHRGEGEVEVSIGQSQGGHGVGVVTIRPGALRQDVLPQNRQVIRVKLTAGKRRPCNAEEYSSTDFAHGTD